MELSFEGYDRLEGYLSAAVEDLDSAYEESEGLRGDGYFLAEPYKIALSGASRSIAKLLDMLKGEKKRAMERYMRENRRRKGKRIDENLDFEYVKVDDVPERILPFALGGDSGSLDEEEIETYANWLSDNDFLAMDRAEKIGYFSHTPIFGEPGKCVTAVFKRAAS